MTTRSYGKSRKVVSADGSHLANSKREVGKDMLALVDALFPDAPPVVLIGRAFPVPIHSTLLTLTFPLADARRPRREGRLSLGQGQAGQDYRSQRARHCPDTDPVQALRPRNPFLFSQRGDLCFETDGSVSSLHAGLTYDSTPRHAPTFRMYHWILLAMPPPLPEQLIFSTPDQSVWYARHSITTWSGPAASNSYDADLMDSWCGQYADKDVLLGALEDYRAGATVDLEHDEADGDHVLSPTSSLRPPRLAIPFLALWCKGLQATGSSIPAEQEAGGVEGIWRARGPEGERTRAKAVETEGAGHFLPTEATDEVGREIEQWLARWF